MYINVYIFTLTALLVRENITVLPTSTDEFKHNVHSWLLQVLFVH